MEFRTSLSGWQTHGVLTIGIGNAMELLSGAMVQGSELKLLAPMVMISMLLLKRENVDSDSAMIGTMFVEVHPPT